MKRYFSRNSDKASTVIKMFIGSQILGLFGLAYEYYDYSKWIKQRDKQIREKNEKIKDNENNCTANKINTNNEITRCSAKKFINEFHKNENQRYKELFKNRVCDSAKSKELFDKLKPPKN